MYESIDEQLLIRSSRRMQLLDVTSVEGALSVLAGSRFLTSTVERSRT